MERRGAWSNFYGQGRLAILVVSLLCISIDVYTQYTGKVKDWGARSTGCRLRWAPASTCLRLSSSSLLRLQMLFSSFLSTVPGRCPEQAGPTGPAQPPSRAKKKRRGGTDAADNFALSRVSPVICQPRR